MKTDMRDIYLSSRRRAKRWWWGGGEQRTASCQILVAPPFAIHVVMQRMSTKIMPKCSISCNEITQLTWSIACCCAKQAAKYSSRCLIASFSLMISSSSSERRRTELVPELCDDRAAFWALTSLESITPFNIEYLQHTLQYLARPLDRQFTSIEALPHRPWLFPPPLVYKTIESIGSFLQLTSSPWRLTISWPYCAWKKPSNAC
jgi:hypothetical protein